MEKFFPPHLLDIEEFVCFQTCGTVHQYGIKKQNCVCFGAYIAMRQFPEQLPAYRNGRNWFYDRCHHFGFSIQTGEFVLKNLAFLGKTPLHDGTYYHHLEPLIELIDPFDDTTWFHDPAHVMSWFNGWVDHIRNMEY